MHYYQHHIGDFIKDTSNLTNDQLAVYLRMLWIYYTEEKPFADEPEDIAFAVRSDEKTVRLLLKHFFERQDGNWHQPRCDREIAEFHSKAEKARSSANARWKNADALRTHNGRNADATVFDANQEPITNNQEPDKTNTPRKRGANDYSIEFEQAWSEYPSRPGNSKAAAFKAWAARIKCGASPEAMIEGTKRYAAYCRAMGTEPQFIKQAATFYGPDRHFDSDWTVRDLPRSATPLVSPRPLETFRERDERMKRKTYEEITGRPHPDNLRESGQIIDITPTVPFLEGNQ